MGDVVLKIEDINEIVLDFTTDEYTVVFERLDDANFEQTVNGENLCECCGADVSECDCPKTKAIVSENMLLNYVNDLFNAEDNDVTLIIDGTKYRKK